MNIKKRTKRYIKEDIYMEKVYIFGHRNPDTDSVTAYYTILFKK